MPVLNNPIWIMSSAFDQLLLPALIEKAQAIGVQGIDLCVFRRDGTRQDHVATHLDYETFNLEDARRTLDTFREARLKLSLGAFDNLIGGPEGQRRKNQDHLLRLIRIAHLLGGERFVPRSAAGEYTCSRTTIANLVRPDWSRPQRKHERPAESALDFNV